MKTLHRWPWNTEISKSNNIQLLHFIECDMMCYVALKSNIDQCRIILHKMKCFICFITFNTPRFFLCIWINSRDLFSFLVQIHSVSRISKVEISRFKVKFSTLKVKISRFEVQFFRIKSRNFKIKSQLFDFYFSTMSLIHFRK